MQMIKGAVDDSILAAWPAEVLMRVDLTTTAGARQTFEIANPLGHEKRPMQDTDISAKFERLAIHVYVEPRTHELLEQWWGIAQQPTLGPALDLLRR